MTANNLHAVRRLETKIVVVLAEGLSAAEAANAAAVLALSAGIDDSTLGADGIGADGLPYGRIDQHPVPVLEADQAVLTELHHGSAHEESGLHVVAFTEVARRARDYRSYLDDLLAAEPSTNPYVGLLVRGPRNRVTRVTKRLRLFGSPRAVDAAG